MQHDAPDVTTTAPAPPSLPVTRKITPYVAVWAGLAVVALAYISVAVARPDFLGAATPDTMRTAENNRTQRSRSSTDVELEQKLARMEQDLQSSQAARQTQTADKQSHLDRIAALEAKTAQAEAAAKAQGTVSAPFPAVTPSNIAETAATEVSKQAADEIADRLAGTKILNNAEALKAATENSTTVLKQTAKAETEKKVAGVVADAVTQRVPQAAQVTELAKSVVKPAAQIAAAKPVAKKLPAKVAALPKPKAAPVKAAPKPVAKKKPSNIKTGSVGKAATKPISFGPAVVTRATRPIGVRIATGPSVDSLRLSWNALADRHGAPLKRLQPRYVTGIGATGLTYDLIAGPFNTSNEASEVCARLHANGARCALGEFTGNAL